MKRIINGRLWDDRFMNEVASRSFDVEDPVTGVRETYRETLLREYVLKPGHTLDDTWVEGGYGRRIVRDNCDLTKGQFVLRVARGYDDGVFVLVTDDEARAWFERWHAGDTGLYEQTFGTAGNPWTDDGAIRLVERAEAERNSMKWDKERAEERANKAEAGLAALKSELEALKAEKAGLEAGLEALTARKTGLDAESGAPTAPEGDPF